MSGTVLARKQFEERVTRAIRTIMRTRGDNCSICGREYQHRDVTFGGVDADGQPQLVGKCCSTKLKLTLGTGIYLRHSQLRGAS